MGEWQKMNTEKRIDVLREQADLLEEIKDFEDEVAYILSGFVTGLNNFTNYEVILDDYLFNLEKVDDYILEFKLEFVLEFYVPEKYEEELSCFHKQFNQTICLDCESCCNLIGKLEHQIFDYLSNLNLDIAHEQANFEKEMEEKYGYDL